MSHVEITKLKEGTRPILFAVHASGGVLTYGRLARHLDSNQPVYLLKGKGLDTARHAFRDIHHLARCYAEEIVRIQPDGPFMICGRTGEITLETGQQLMQLGKTVSLTMVFDNAPHWEWSKGKEPSRLRRVVFRTRRRLSIATYHLLDRLGALSARVSPQLQTVGSLSLFDRVRIKKFSEKRSPIRPKRINWDLFVDYVVKPYHAKLVYIQSIGQKHKKMDYVEKWKAIADEVVYHMTPGEHSTMYEPPHVHVLAHLVQKECDAAVNSVWSNEGDGKEF